MTNESILNELKSKFSDKILAHSEEYGVLIVEITPENNIEILDFLKNESEGAFKFLTTLAGIHYPEKSEKELCVMYQVKNIATNISLRLKAYLPINNPTIKSISELFPTANWMERQEFDFFGINFIGHPDLRRILNMEDMDYHPMRKEYKLEDGTRDDKEDKYFGR